MPNSPTDFYHQKTDAELLFFVEHPDYYQPDLVEAARRELKRRGVAPAAQVPLFVPDSATPDDGATAPRSGLHAGLGALLLGAVLVVSLGAWYFVSKKNSPSTLETTADKPVRKVPPTLTEVATSVIPNYDGAVAQSVDQQLQRVPAAERATAKTAKEGQALRQYRELTKRFWTAETQTEYVLDQARRGKLTNALPGHVQSADGSWQQFNKALVYSYQFGPAMANHLDLMTRVARQQQEALNDLLIVANNPQEYENDKTRQRDADVSDLLSGLLPKSPVTGERYSPIVRKVNL